MGGEADLYLVDHLSQQRPLVSRILCPNEIDATEYQARELSFCTDQVDCWFIHACCKAGHPHFLSVTAALFVIVASLCNFYFMAARLALPRVQAFLCSLLFCSTPNIFFGLTYVRSSKFCVALLLFFLIWFIILKLKTKIGKIDAAVCFLLALALCWSDRQGWYMVAATCGVLTAARFVFSKKFGLFIAATMSAAAAHMLYNFCLAPAVIKSVAGFDVSYAYQKLPWETLLHNKLYYAWAGVTTQLDTMSYFFGGVAPVVVLGVLLFVVWKLKSERRWLVAGGFVLLAAMNSLMVLRHIALLKLDVKLVAYYYVPATVLLLVATANGLTLLNKTLSSKLATYGLLCLVASNIYNLPKAMDALHGGTMEGYILATPYLKQAIRELERAPSGASTTLYNEGRNSTCALSPQSMIYNPYYDMVTSHTLNVQMFVYTSHFYNFLRSEKGLPFYQPPD